MSNKVTPSGLLCLKCGNNTITWRYMGIQKKMYHKMMLYCPVCKKDTKHIELKNMDEFIASLNFKDEETLTEDEKKILQLIKKE